MSDGHWPAGGDVDRRQLAGLLREAGRAPDNWFPVERIPHYLEEIDRGVVRCIAGTEDGVLGAALLYSPFGPVRPLPDGYLVLQGLYIDEVAVTEEWRGRGWSGRLFARLREVEGPEPDVYVDCAARNLASVMMIRSAGYAHVLDYPDPERSEPAGPVRVSSLFRHTGRAGTVAEGER
ncbi:hypothetical protein [Kitasatospora sp. NPDC093806]|uniref:hypothetical protein n=1 Tax=Kitasatospora sp. NPDC093806 TaxID=3155075 RepID=UPI00344837D1